MPQHNEPPSSNAATFDMRNQHPVLDFDGSTNESAVFSGVMPQHYAGTTGVTVYIHYAMTSDNTGTNDTDFLSAAYRWSVYKNDKFEIGPAIGLGYFWLDASLTGRVQIGDDDLGGPETVRGEVGSITGDIGGFFYWWPGKRWMARGDFRYIAVGLDDADASIAEGRASLTWYPWSRFGVGLQYQYTSVEYKRDVTITRLGGKIQYDGLQILASAAF